MGIEKYITFDISKYLKDYYYYRQIVEKLQDEYDALDGVTAIPINADKVQTSPAADNLEKIALDRVNLSARIEDYREHIKTCEIALTLLSDEERAVIDAYYGAGYADQESEIPASRAQLYRIRIEAQRKIGLLICNANKYE